MQLHSIALGERPCPHQIKISEHYNLGKAISRSNIEIAIQLLRDYLEERSKKEYDALGEQRKKLLKPEEKIYREERKEEVRLRREQEERRKKEKETPLMPDRPSDKELIDKADLLFLIGELNEALECFDKYLDKFPLDIFVWSNKAALLKRLEIMQLLYYATVRLTKSIHLSLKFIIL